MNVETKLHRFRLPEAVPLHIKALDAMPWRVLAVAMSFGVAWLVVFGAQGGAGFLGGYAVAELIRLTIRKRG